MEGQPSKKLQVLCAVGNDNYGHEVGDKVLRMVANDLRHNLRAADTICRWGGDEFLAILYDVQNQKGLKPIASKLHKLVGCSRLDLEERNLIVSISIGATLLLPGDTPESFVRRADELMYTASAQAETSSPWDKTNPWVFTTIML